VPDPAASSEPQYLYLTTRGRKTGKPREIEIWFTRRGRCFYLVSERRLRAHWVQNLLEEPRVRWNVDGRKFRGRARVLRAAGSPELVRDIQARSKSKYGWGDGLVVELDPGAPAKRRRPHGQA
jgi:deazaflavin-dependent oxidoreductase (nitroreductase family)